MNVRQTGNAEKYRRRKKEGPVFAGPSHSHAKGLLDNCPNLLPLDVVSATGTARRDNVANDDEC